MTNVKLSTHFSLAEMCDSASAVKLGITNLPQKEEYLTSLKYICINMLEPVRARYGAPIKVTSGYRCKQLNAAIGGATKSQHCLGQAVDVMGQSPLDTVLLYVYLRCTNFDQLILEQKGNSTWVHVSCKINAVANRHMSLFIKDGKVIDSKYIKSY